MMKIITGPVLLGSNPLKKAAKDLHLLRSPALGIPHMKTRSRTATVIPVGQKKYLIDKRSSVCLAKVFSACEPDIKHI